MPCLRCPRRQFLAPALRPALAVDLVWPRACIDPESLTRRREIDPPLNTESSKWLAPPSGLTANSENHTARTKENGVFYIALAPFPLILPCPHHRIHNPSRIEGNGQLPRLPDTRYTNQQTHHPSPHRLSNRRGFHAFSDPYRTRLCSPVPPRINHGPHFRHPEGYRRYPVLWFGPVGIAPAAGINFSACVMVGFIFQFYLRRYRFM